MMWIPFGGKAGIGGRGGGGMLRTVRRAVRSGGAGGVAQDSFSHSSSTTTSTNTNRDQQSASNVLSLSSSTDSTPHSPFSPPIYSNSTIPTWHFCSSPVGSEGFDWDYVDGSVCDGEIDCYDDPVFGSVPSIDEVQNAVSALSQFPIFAYNSDKDVADEITSPTVPMNKISSDGTERDWIEPSLQQLRGSRMLQPYGSDRVYDAFHLLQTDPCIQRMVVSVSSDKTVWEAVLNNDAVREIRQSLSKVDKSVSEKPNDTSDSSMAATNILNWIFDKTKVKVTELIEKITKLVNELFQPLVNDKATGDTYQFEEKVRASFLLSVVVLLVVVVGRAHKA